MRIFLLDKVVLLIKGNASQFLNGLTSNTLDKPHNAFLNMHGRIIATFDQMRLSDDEFLLVIEQCVLKALEDHVARYLKINRSTMTKTDFKVYFDLDGTAPVTEGDQVIRQKQGRLILTQKKLSSTVSAEEFTLFRLKHSIPMQGIDYHDEMLLNVHEYEFVSYEKGCFLGQEMVAKVHNRSKPSWALVVRYKDELSPEEQDKMTSTVLDPQTQRALGFVFVANV